MILSQPDLRKAVRQRKIVFDPELDDDQWGQASVDLRLGFSFTCLRDLPGVTLSVAEGLPALGASGFWQTKELRQDDGFGRPESYELQPGGFVLAMTHESIEVPRNMIALVEGRSTYARMGLSMHQTAPWVQPGWSGSIVLEIRNSGPLTIKLTPLVDRPCQLTFFRLTSPVPRDKVYGSRPSEFYTDQRHPLRHDRQADRPAAASPRARVKVRKKSVGRRTKGSKKRPR